jgi:lipoprotein NlpI
MRFRVHILDLFIAILIGILVVRHWPADPAREAWRAAFQDLMRGEYAAALPNLDRVLTAEPRFHRGFFYRGFALFFLGQFGDAARDFDEGLALGGDSYMLFWRYLAKRRQGGSGEAELLAGLADRELSLQEWPGILAAGMLRMATEDAVLDLAGAAPPDVRAGRVAEARFYLGQARLLAGDREGAVAHFRAAEATGAANYLEWRAATAELRNLGVGRTP